SVLSKLLAPTPAERYGSAQAIREDLERLRSGAQTQAEREGWPRTADQAETRRTQPPTDADEEKTRRTSKPQSPQSPQSKVGDTRGRRLFTTKVRRFAVVALLVVVLGIV